MINTTMDIWLDSAHYERDVLEVLRDNLMQVFNLPANQADVLINGNSHRIKRSCTAEEAEKLMKQFMSWSIDLRVEVISGEELDMTNESASHKKDTKQVRVDTTFSLAPPGDAIPNLQRDTTAPNVVTDHLHLLTE